MNDQKNFDGRLRRVKVQSKDFDFEVSIENFDVQRENPTACRSCGAPMIFAITKKGKTMPLDAKPNEKGMYTAHFATCPNASSFRKKS